MKKKEISISELQHNSFELSLKSQYQIISEIITSYYNNSHLRIKYYKEKNMINNDSIKIILRLFSISNKNKSKSLGEWIDQLYQLELNVASQDNDAYQKYDVINLGLKIFEIKREWSKDDGDRFIAFYEIFRYINQKMIVNINTTNIVFDFACDKNKIWIEALMICIDHINQKYAHNIHNNEPSSILDKNINSSRSLEKIFKFAANYFPENQHILTFINKDIIKSICKNICKIYEIVKIMNPGSLNKITNKILRAIINAYQKNLYCSVDIYIKDVSNIVSILFDINNKKIKISSYDESPIFPNMIKNQSFLYTNRSMVMETLFSRNTDASRKYILASLCMLDKCLLNINNYYKLCNSNNIGMLNNAMTILRMGRIFNQDAFDRITIDNDSIVCAMQIVAKKRKIRFNRLTNRTIESPTRIIQKIIDTGMALNINLILSMDKNGIKIPKNDLLHKHAIQSIITFIQKSIHSIKNKNKSDYMSSYLIYNAKQISSISNHIDNIYDLSHGHEICFFFMDLFVYGRRLIKVNARNINAYNNMINYDKRTSVPLIKYFLATVIESRMSIKGDILKSLYKGRFYDAIMSTPYYANIHTLPVRIDTKNLYRIASTHKHLSYHHLVFSFSVSLISAYAGAFFALDRIDKLNIFDSPDHWAYYFLVPMTLMLDDLLTKIFEMNEALENPKDLNPLYKGIIAALTPAIAEGYLFGESFFTHSKNIVSKDIINIMAWIGGLSTAIHYVFAEGRYLSLLFSMNLFAGEKHLYSNKPNICSVLKISFTNLIVLAASLGYLYPITKEWSEIFSHNILNKFAASRATAYGIYFASIIGLAHLGGVLCLYGVNTKEMIYEKYKYLRYIHRLNPKGFLITALLSVYSGLAYALATYQIISEGISSLSMSYDTSSAAVIMTSLLVSFCFFVQYFITRCSRSLALTSGYYDRRFQKQIKKKIIDNVIWNNSIKNTNIKKYHKGLLSIGNFYFVFCHLAVISIFTMIIKCFDINTILSYCIGIPVTLYFTSYYDSLRSVDSENLTFDHNALQITLDSDKHKIYPSKFSSKCMKKTICYLMISIISSFVGLGSEFISEYYNIFSLENDVDIRASSECVGATLQALCSVLLGVILLYFCLNKNENRRQDDVINDKAISEFTMFTVYSSNIQHSDSHFTEMGNRYNYGSFQV